MPLHPQWQGGDYVLGLELTWSPALGQNRSVFPPLGSCWTYLVCYRTQRSPGKGYLNSLQAEQELGVSLLQ